MYSGLVSASLNMHLAHASHRSRQSCRMSHLPSGLSSQSPSRHLSARVVPCSTSLHACLNIHQTRHYTCSHRCEASATRRYCEIGGRKSCSIPIAIIVIDGRFALPYRALRRIFVLGSRFLQALVVPLYSAEVY
jgi:hypothetical protein